MVLTSAPSLTLVSDPGLDVVGRQALWSDILSDGIMKSVHYYGGGGGRRHGGTEETVFRRTWRDCSQAACQRRRRWFGGMLVAVTAVVVARYHVVLAYGVLIPTDSVEHIQ